MKFRDTATGDEFSTPESTYAQPSATLTYILPPTRWFEVTVKGQDGRLSVERVTAHALSPLDGGGLLFQTLQPSAYVSAYEPAKGENPSNAKPLNPRTVEYMTTRIFMPGTVVSVEETQLPTMQLGHSTRAN